MNTVSNWHNCSSLLSHKNPDLVRLNAAVRGLALAEVFLDVEDSLPFVRISAKQLLSPEKALRAAARLASALECRLVFVELSGKEAVFIATYDDAPGAAECAAGYGYPLEAIATAWGVKLS